MGAEVPDVAPPPTSCGPPYPPAAAFGFLTAAMIISVPLILASRPARPPEPDDGLRHLLVVFSGKITGLNRSPGPSSRPSIGAIRWIDMVRCDECQGRIDPC